eukprot:sb/3471503/
MRVCLFCFPHPTGLQRFGLVMWDCGVFQLQQLSPRDPDHHLARSISSQGLSLHGALRCGSSSLENRTMEGTQILTFSKNFELPLNFFFKLNTTSSRARQSIVSHPFLNEIELTLSQSHKAAVQISLPILRVTISRQVSTAHTKVKLKIKILILSSHIPAAVQISLPILRVTISRQFDSVPND